MSAGSALRRAEVDEARAWACLLANALVLPGLGSLIAGRRAGWVQAGAALAGFALTAVWFAWFVAAWVRAGSFPLDADLHLPEGAFGVLLFAGSWLWGLVTGVAVVRGSRRRAAGAAIDTLPRGA